MKITDVKILGSRFFVDTALVQVETDSGITGIGATAQRVCPVAAVIEGNGNGAEKPLRDKLIGQDPTQPRQLWEKMFNSGAFGRGGEGGLAVNAMAAIDLALWDLAGKAANLPIYKMLGGAVQQKIMVYASTSYGPYVENPTPGKVSLRSIDEIVRECRYYIDQGIKAIKFGWGNRFAPEHEKTIAAIRDAVGPDIYLMFDFGCPAYLRHGHNVKHALHVAEIAHKYDAFFVEESLHPYDVEGFAELTRRTRIKIATGESLVTMTDFAHFINRRAVDVIQPDAQQIGISQFIKVAHLAEQAGILCIPHCPWSPLAVAAHLNVLATTTNGIMIEYPAYEWAPPGTFHHNWIHAIHNRMIEHPLTVHDGYLQLPKTPGLGLGNFVPEVIEEMELMRCAGS